MSGLLMDDELQRKWKEVALAYSRNAPSVCLVGVRKTTG
jgi:hypothetical protein